VSPFTKKLEQKEYNKINTNKTTE